MNVEDRISAIEKELAEIKARLSSPQSPRIVKLKGLWRGLRVSDEDVDDAKKSLFTLKRGEE